MEELSEQQKKILGNLKSLLSKTDEMTEDGFTKDIVDTCRHIAREHKKNCKDKDCKVKLIYIPWLLFEGAGIKLTQEEMQDFL